MINCNDWLQQTSLYSFVNFIENLLIFYQHALIFEKWIHKILFRKWFIFSENLDIFLIYCTYLFYYMQMHFYIMVGMHTNIYFWLRFGTANSINTYLRWGGGVFFNLKYVLIQFGILNMSLIYFRKTGISFKLAFKKEFSVLNYLLYLCLVLWN